MRILIAAALAASLTGAAWAGQTEDYGQCHRYDSEVNSTEINAIVQEALDEAMEQIRAAELDAATTARIEARVEAVMARAEQDLEAANEAEYWSDAEREQVEARVEAAMARVEAAVDRAMARLDRAERQDQPKLWRPRY
jgi:hypothetical protein